MSKTLELWRNAIRSGFGTVEDNTKMLTKEEMQEMMEYLAGGCHMGGIQVAVESAFEQELTDEEFEQLQEFLDIHECYECEHCGWQTHPGEGCDCDEFDDECPDCGNKEDECECE